MLVALGALVLAGAALRLALTLSYRPAFLGYPDSVDYIVGARDALFTDPLRVAGYSFFLRVVHAADADLSFTIVVQHGLGIAAGILLFAAVRRVGGPPWLGLVPAAVVLLGGDQVFLEHAVLTESLYAFLTAGALYAALRCLDGRALPWALAAGALAGLAATVRVAGLALIPLLALWLVPARDRPPRARATLALAGLAASLAVVGGYLAAAHDQTGQWSLARHGAYHFYGRVAPFADCSEFTPPAGTGELCEATPKSRRAGPLFYIFNSHSPAVRRFGQPPLGRPTAADMRRLRAFATAAAVHQPLDYAEAVGRDLWRYVWPSAFRPPESSPGPADYARLFLVDADRTYIAGPTVRSYYSTAGTLVRAGPFGAIRDYERVTRVEGPLMVVLVLLTLAAPFACTGRLRAGAWLLTGATLALMVVPVLAIDYDGRFAVPAYGPLAAAAALGAAGLIRRRRRAPATPPCRGRE
ncbi:MAG TPA: hypothetical protein VF545_01385 [Thermoleophilaceae bacterium]